MLSEGDGGCLRAWNLSVENRPIRRKTRRSRPLDAFFTLVRGLLALGCGCEHLVDPLPLEHHAVDDGRIQSLAYDRQTQCLEVRFKWPWHNVRQYRPVPLWLVREIWKARPMNTALQELVMNSRRIRSDEVRTEGKLLVSLLRGWQVLSARAV